MTSRLHEDAARRRAELQSRNVSRVAQGMVQCPDCPKQNGKSRTWIKPTPKPIPDVPEKESTGRVDGADQDAGADVGEPVGASVDAENTGIPDGKLDPAVREWQQNTPTLIVGKLVEPSPDTPPSVKGQPSPQPAPQPSQSPPVSQPIPFQSIASPSPPGTPFLRRSRGRKQKWAVGVTTVPQRFDDLLPRTLASLRAGGFDPDRLFVDGMKGFDAWKASDRFGIQVTNRDPKVGAFGNWILSLGELLIRFPTAERFAMFQDDLVTCLGLKDYLDGVEMPAKSYLNLFTFPPGLPGRQSQIAPPSPDHRGWFRSNQRGRGGLALVMPREFVRLVLAAPSIIKKPEDALRGTQNLDGAVVTAAQEHGWTEVVHHPSLVQHTGTTSTLGHSNPLATSFMGETFDLRTLIPTIKQ